MTLKTAPVGLKAGDEFRTPFGPIDILDVDGEDYLIHDPRTGEEAWLDHGVLVRIMSAVVTDWK